jgi:hypothetical protein
MHNIPYKNPFSAASCGNQNFPCEKMTPSDIQDAGLLYYRKSRSGVHPKTCTTFEKRDPKARQQCQKHLTCMEDTMKIPPYWARARYEEKDRNGERHVFVAFGWSFASLNEAREEALVRAKRIFEYWTGGAERLDRYAYHDRPIREEILREISDDGGKIIALITRNRYGAEVLNCSQVLFVDVDFPKARRPGFFESFMDLFRKRKQNVGESEEVRQTIAAVSAWARENPDHSFRLYRTKEGLRLLFTGKLYEPGSEETQRILKELKSDPLYVMLTQKQECFRARLTSKPWRCGSPKPPVSFPWEDDAKEREFRTWESLYKKKDAEFRVCDLVEAFGGRPQNSLVRTVMEIHDRATRVKEKAPLA